MAVRLFHSWTNLSTWRRGEEDDKDTPYSALRWKTVLLDPLIPIFVGKDIESSFIFSILKIHSSWKTCNPNLHTHTRTLTHTNTRTLRHTRRQLSRWLTKIPSAREWAVYFSSQVWIQRKFAGKITNNSLSTKWAIYLHILHIGIVFSHDTYSHKQIIYENINSACILERTGTYLMIFKQLCCAYFVWPIAYYELTIKTHTYERLNTVNKMKCRDIHTLSTRIRRHLRIMSIMKMFTSVNWCSE